MTFETITLIATAVEFFAVSVLATVFLTLPSHWCNTFYSKSIGMYLLFDAFGNGVELVERLGQFSPDDLAVDDIIVAGAAAAMALLIVVFSVKNRNEARKFIKGVKVTPLSIMRDGKFTQEFVDHVNARNAEDTNNS